MKLPLSLVFLLFCVPLRAAEMLTLALDDKQTCQVKKEVLFQSTTLRNMLDGEVDVPDNRMLASKIHDEIRDKKTLDDAVFILQQNFNLTTQTKDFNASRLQEFFDRCKLAQLVHSANIITHLDLVKPENTDVPSILDRCTNALVKKIKCVDEDEKEYKSLKNLNTDLARLITPQVMPARMDQYLLQPYSQQLYAQKKELSLPPYEKIYYFSEDLIIYCYNNKLFVKKENADSVGFSILPQLPKYAEARDTPEYLDEKNPKYIERMTESGSLLFTIESQVQINQDKSCFVYFASEYDMVFYCKMASMSLQSAMTGINGSFSACCFASNESLYLGDKEGNLYSFNCNEKQSDANPLLIKKVCDGPIVGITTNDNGEIIVLDTYEPVTEKIADLGGQAAQVSLTRTVFYKGIKKQDDLLFERLETPEDMLDNACSVNISPDGRFLFVNRILCDGYPWTDAKLYLYDLITKKSTFLVGIGGAWFAHSPYAASWLPNSELLIFNYVNEYGSTNSAYHNRDFDPTNVYFCINPHSHNFWALSGKQGIRRDGERGQNQPDVPRVDCDGTKAIEKTRDFLGITIASRKIVDDNMQRTLEFLNPHSENVHQQLIGVALLNQLIKKNDEFLNSLLHKITTNRKKPTGPLAKIYDKYLPEGVKNVWEVRTTPLEALYTNLVKIKNMVMAYKFYLVAGVAAIAVVYYLLTGDYNFDEDQFFRDLEKLLVEHRRVLKNLH